MNLSIVKPQHKIMPTECLKSICEMKMKHIIFSTVFSASAQFYNQTTEISESQ
jgi:hypothetical protein